MHRSINIHLYPSPFVNESRIFKQASSISTLNIFDEIHLVGTRLDGEHIDTIIKENIFVRRFGISNKIGVSVLRKIAMIFVWYVSVFRFYRKKNVYCINAHSLSALPLAMILSRVTSSKLIYDPHELETETAGLMGLRKRISKFIERKLIKAPDSMFVVSESIRDWYQTEYRIDSPTVVMNSPALTNVEKKNYFREKFNISGDTKVFLYQGVLSRGRGIEGLLSLFRTRTTNDAVIVFLGYGILEKEIRDAGSTCNKIFIHSAVSPAQLLEFSASADVGICLIENVCLSYYFSLPNKLFEYSMAKIPVIASNMKEIGSFVNRYKMGFVVDELSCEALNLAIDAACNADLNVLGNNAYCAVLENSWEAQEARMLSVYRKMFNIGGNDGTV